jgi:hypothetical protein
MHRIIGKHRFFRLDSESLEDAELFETANSDTSPHLPKEMTMDADADQPAQMEILKEEFTQLKAQNATIMNQQAQILQKLGGAIPTLTPPTTTPSSDTKLKLASPNDFDRDQTKG